MGVDVSDFFPKDAKSNLFWVGGGAAGGQVVILKSVQKCKSYDLDKLNL